MRDKVEKTEEQTDDVNTEMQLVIIKKDTEE